MRFFITVLISAGALCAQPAQPPVQPPAQSPSAAPELSPDTVVASFEGKKLTYGEISGMLAILPPQQQQMARQNPKLLVQQYFLWQHLAEMAEQKKLDQKSPVKEQLEYQRRYLLMQAALNDVMNNLAVDDPEVEKHYEATKDKYTQVKVKTIYVSFSSSPEAGGAGGAKVLSEEEAKAKITKILAEIRGGADFVKMVKQYSEDATSREKDGDLETFRKTDNIPDAIRAAVFQLKQGEVSEPVRQPNGYYLFRAEQVTTQTLQQVRGQVSEEARQAKFQQWMAKLNSSIDFKVEAPGFFKAAAPLPSLPVAAPK